MSGKIKWGILGCANIAHKSFIPALLKASNAELCAVASRDAVKVVEWQQKFRFSKVYDTYDHLLDDPEIQAVYIPLPNHLHKEWTIKAAQKGKHVLCEKPIALNAEECQEMIQVCKKHNVKLMEAYMYRYSDRTRKVLDLIREGVIGEIRHINSTFGFSYYDAANYRMVGEYGGGSLYDVGCYPLNFSGMIPGQTPVEFSAEGVFHQGIDMAFSAVLKYDSGVISTIHSWFNGFGKQYSEIIGTKGMMMIPDTFKGNAGVITVVTDAGKEEIEVRESDRFLLEIEDFSDAIIHDREPMLHMEESLRNINMLDQLLHQIRPLA
jgi:D-xylose 1-dehydrogenase (NADP+, D-xylono-1,5-lactone-forming)